MTSKAGPDDYALPPPYLFLNSNIRGNTWKGRGAADMSMSLSDAPLSARRLCWCGCSARRSPLLVKLRFMGKINISLTYHRHFKRRLFIIRWHQRHRRGRRRGSGKGPWEDFFPVFSEEKTKLGRQTCWCLCVMWWWWCHLGFFHCPISCPSETEAGLLLSAWSDLCTLYCLRFQKEGLGATSGLFQ